MEGEVKKLIKQAIENQDYDMIREFMLVSLEEMGGPITDYAIYTIKLLITELEKHEQKRTENT